MKRSAMPRRSSPLPRGTSQLRRTELRRGWGAVVGEDSATIQPRRGKPRTPQQRRRAAADREYARLRASFLAVFNLCARCGSQATDLHHRKGRGPYYLDVSTWTPLCRSCHRWVGTHPAAAIKAGLSEPRLAKRDVA